MIVRRFLIAAVAIVAAALFGWAVMSGLGRLLSTPATPAPEPAAEAPPLAPPPGPPAAGPRIKATLFFASADGQRMVGVEREVPLAEGTVAQARALVEALLAGDAPAPLSSTIPEGTSLRGIFVSARNEVFIDLDATVRTKHPGGSMQELLTVYTLVNTIVVNLPSVGEVQILINGQEADTLAGHVDLRRPLRKNEGLIVSPDTETQSPS
ncbi:MAG: GerMN domain-containing protein [Acidobacteria bacterium]|nr:GerMN domain-containing protein [Acidobacteriota bacterium]